MPNEKDKFISECISQCMKDGTKQDQAIAICYSKWEKKHSKDNSVKVYKNKKKVFKYNSSKED